MERPTLRKPWFRGNKLTPEGWRKFAARRALNRRNRISVRNERLPGRSLVLKPLYGHPLHDTILDRKLGDFLGDLQYNVIVL